MRLMIMKVEMGWKTRCLTLLFLSVVVSVSPPAGIQGNPADSGAGISGGATPLSQVWGQPVRRETRQLPGGTDGPTVRTHAGIHQTQQTV